MQQVGDFVHWCLMCQQVKVEHQRPAGLLQPLEVVACHDGFCDSPVTDIVRACRGVGDRGTGSQSRHTFWLC